MKEPDLPQPPEARHRLDPAREAAKGTRQRPVQEALGYGSDLAPQEPHLLDYVRVLYKRRWTAATAFIVVMLGVTVYTFTATPIYEGTAKLLIEAENPNIISFKEVIEESQTRQDYYQTQYNILQSRTLARKTLASLSLWSHPEFGGEPEDPGFSLRGAAGDLVATVAQTVAEPFRAADLDAERGPVAQPFRAARAGPDETEAQSRAVDKLLGSLRVAPVRHSRIVDLRYRSPDPDLAARVVNAHARGYIEQNLEFKFLSSQEASDWLGERLAEQRTQVELAEAALQGYREQNDAISLSDRENIVVQKLADLNAAVTRAKTERLEKEALYRQLQTIENDRSALDTFPAIQANAFIQQQKAELAGLERQLTELSEKLGDRHPDIIKVRSAIQTSETRLQGEIGKVVQGVRNQFLAARAQENSLAAVLEQQKREALTMNRRAIEYNVLARDVESSRQIYDSLLQRAKETGVSAALRTSNIRIVDAAEKPRAPASPRKRQNLLLALLGGGLLAVGLCFFFEYIDNRLKTPDEVKAHLGLPSLGFLPLLSKKVIENGYPLINNGVPPGFSEAFRAIRTNILFSSTEEGSRSVAVTSTGPDEGKTIVACNLSVALAQAGQRVLLIDADMRRPKVHKVFRQRQEPGLSNLMVGNAKASDTVRKSGVTNLWLLTAGRLPPNPAELLGSKRFGDFLGTLGDHFDWVILDTPPVMAVTDATLVAHSASGVVYVVGAEMTSRHTAQHALEQLDSAQSRFIGAILNRVDLDRNAYYYSQYYRREYASYYTEHERRASAGSS